MIKKVLLICTIGMLFLAPGCSSNSTQNGIDVQNNSIVENNETPAPDTQNAASLGGIRLGDSAEAVVKILGSDYVESIEADELGSIGEDMAVWSFDSGITVFLGSESNKVLRIVSHSSDFQTYLGIKVGDTGKAAFEKYQREYEQVKSRHSEEVLTGWFHIGDEQIIIFDFDKDDNSLANQTAAPDSTVQAIVLAYWKHFD